MPEQVDPRSSRLYYEDAYQTQFDATVLEVFPVQERWAAVLDTSYFYPTSGGQPHDTGFLNGGRVVDVQAAANGTVLHLLDMPLQPGLVQGAIDWPRRYDYMQQHSGQHLLSQIFFALFAMETVSVHFGAETSTLELAAPELTGAQLNRVEERATEIVAAHLPIRAYWVDEAQVGQIPLRRPPQVTGAIRIVEIADFDWSACGGTHVRGTGEIGPVKLLRVERMRGNVRIHFVCGRRAMADYGHKHDLLMEMAGLLDTHYTEAPALLSRLQERNRDLERELQRQEERLLLYQAQELLAAARHVGGVRVVTQPLPDMDPRALKTLAAALTVQDRVIVLLACAPGPRATAIFARSDDVNINMGQLLSQTLAHFGGGGGGRPEFAQGGGVDAGEINPLLAFAMAKIESGA